MKTLSLPFVATRKNQVALVFLVGVITVAAYGISGNVAIGQKAHLLTMTEWDLAVPLVPWTFWIYSTVYFIYLTSGCLQRDMQGLSRFLYAYVFAYVVAGIYFPLFPTTFPRADFPLPADPDSLTIAAFELFRTIDHPTNCLPSMHVASCVLTSAPFYKKRPRVFIAFVLWGLCISATTLTTKQHYIIDIPAGAAYGLFVHVLFFKVLPFHEPRQQSSVGQLAAEGSLVPPGPASS